MKTDKQPKDFELESLKHELREEVDSRVREHLERAKAWIDLAIGWSTKIIAVGGALILIALGLLGYRNFADVGTRLDKIMDDAEKNANDALAVQKIEMDKKIQDASVAATKTLNEQIQQQLDQAVVSVLLARWQANKGQRFSMLKLDPWEKERLISIVRNPATKADTLVGSLQIFSKSSRDSSDTLSIDEEVEKLLGSLIGEKHVDRKDQARLVSLLRWLGEENRPSLTPLVRLLIERSDTPENLKPLAIHYLGKMADKESIKLMESEMESANGPLKKALLVALAQSSANSPSVLAWTNQIISKQKLDHVDAATFCDLIVAFIEGPVSSRRSFLSGGTDTQDQDHRFIKSKELLIKLATSGARLFYDTEMFGRKGAGSLMISMGVDSGNFSNVSPKLIFSERLIGEAVSDAIGRSDPMILRQLVAFLSVIELQELESKRNFAASLAVTIDKSTSMKIGAEQTIAADGIVGDPVLLPGALDHNPIVKWRDETGHINSGEFTSVSDIGKCRFYVKELQKLEFDDEDDR